MDGNTFIDSSDTLSANTKNFSRSIMAERCQEISRRGRENFASSKRSLGFHHPGGAWWNDVGRWVLPLPIWRMNSTEHLRKWLCNERCASVPPLASRTYWYSGMLTQPAIPRQHMVLHKVQLYSWDPLALMGLGSCYNFTEVVVQTVFMRWKPTSFRLYITVHNGPLWHSSVSFDE